MTNVNKVGYFNPSEWGTLEDMEYWVGQENEVFESKLQECTYLGDMLNDNLLSGNDIKVFAALGMGVKVRNVGYCVLPEMAEKCGMDLKTFKTSLDVLEEEKMVRLGNKVKGVRGGYFMEVSPAAYWKGNFGKREQAIKKWYVTGDYDFIMGNLLPSVGTC